MRQALSQVFPVGNGMFKVWLTVQLDDGTVAFGESRIVAKSAVADTVVDLANHIEADQGNVRLSKKALAEDAKKITS